ncbi:helix-turn-helix domain-containing protein [Kaustia mangrovi]|uniref:Helix-turn-helix domain-containing protein n=1 Tax=Kaustia mangrovi TaxID=2593653 RepID=A0A7S8HBD7_9HYPH|nr:AraC family transcriptional regulator [Kaustia mangrovi]QPC42522.1 helix-turn-helix domain-containing protein [Kaustia mangrovi]
MKAVPQVRSSAYLPFVAFLESAGVPVERDPEGALISAVAHRDKEALVPVHLAHAFLERGARLLGHEDFGVLVGTGMRIEELGAFGRNLCRSLTLHDALNKFPSQYSLYSSAERIWWVRENDVAYFLHSYTFETGHGSCYARHCALLLMRDLIRLSAGPLWQPELLLTTEPGDTSLLRDAFGDPVIRRSKVSGIAFPASLLSIPLDQDRRKRLERIDPDAFDGTIPSDDFVGSLCQVIATLMPEGKCSLDQAAPTLGMHPRTLQRRLSKVGQDYSAILSQVRFEKALRLMADPTLRICDIALELGFQDASNFSRSFRKWTGTRPTAFRRSN